MVTKHIQIIEDKRRQRAFALPKAAGYRGYPRTTATTVRESAGSWGHRSLEWRSSTPCCRSQ